MMPMTNGKHLQGCQLCVVLVMSMVHCMATVGAVTDCQNLPEHCQA